jgi:hypothetical protein
LDGKNIEVTNDEDGVKTMRGGKFNNEINGDRFPWSFGNVERLEKTVRFMTRDLDPVTNIAGGYIATNVGINPGPRVVT